MSKINDYIQDDILIVKNVHKKDVSRQEIYTFIKQNQMERVGPGMYVTLETLEDESYVLSMRCPQGVISHDDALYYYGLIDREPYHHTLTIYTGYNPSSLSASGYQIYTVKKELLTLGKVTVVNHFGHKVPMYDLERTMCDLVRSRNHFEIQDFNTALKTYVQRKDKNLNKLMTYAKAFKIDNVIRQYLEVLL